MSNWWIKKLKHYVLRALNWYTSCSRCETYIFRILIIWGFYFYLQTNQLSCLPISDFFKKLFEKWNFLQKWSQTAILCFSEAFYGLDHILQNYWALFSHTCSHKNRVRGSKNMILWHFAGYSWSSLSQTLTILGKRRRQMGAILPILLGFQIFLWLNIWEKRGQ